MDSGTPSERRRDATPHRSALTVLTVAYTVSLVAAASLLVSRGFQVDWQHWCARWIQPPVHHPAGYVAAHAPAHLPPLPPAPVLRHGSQIIVWHTPPARAYRHASRLAARLPASTTSLSAASASTVSVSIAPARSDRPTYRPTRRAVPARIAQRIAPLTMARRPSSQQHFSYILTPTGTSTPMWAHPVDPTLPPECRPPHPLVAGQE
jgi:hypothetical protein